MTRIVALASGAVLCVAAGYAAGLLRGRQTPEEIARALTAEQRELRRLSSVIDAWESGRGHGSNSEELRRAREPAATQPSPETPENVAAAEAAGVVVDKALALGVWREGDKAEFRRLAPLLSPQRSDELIGKLVVAINSAQLSVKSSVPPF